MSKVNSVRLIGRAGKAPELKSSNENLSIVTFTLATNEAWKDKTGEKKESTDWHNIVAFGNVAVLLNSYVQKGSFLALDGKLKTRQYQDKNGENRYTTEIIVEDVVFLDKKPESQP